MQTYELIAHPAFQPGEVSKVSVRWSELADGRLMLRYKVEGCGALVVPPFHGKGRADDLWRKTCFELFLHDGEGRYREFNFSPCQQWAAWEFGGYRHRTGDFEPAQLPEIIAETGTSIFVLTVFIAQSDVAAAQRGALSAVLEEEHGRMSYWALRHGGLQPDFHDPACFVMAPGSAGRP